jgi:hypothetical protein
MQTPSQASTSLYNSLHHSNTKEQDLINIILSTTLSQRQSILKHYTSSFPSPLQKDISSFISPPLKTPFTNLFSSAVEYDSFLIKKAIKGFSIDIECVYEIITTRPFWHLQLLKQKYHEMFCKDLSTEIEHAISGHIGRDLVILLNTERRSNTQPDHKQCEANAKTLVNVNNEESWGSNEEIFHNIFAMSSPEELLLTIRYYYKQTGVNLISAVDKKMSSKMKVFFKEMLYAIVNPAELFADKLHISVMNRKISVIERVLITRNEIDIKKINEYYKTKYHTELKHDIQSVVNNSKYYQQLLIGLCDK